MRAVFAYLLFAAVAACGTTAPLDPKARRILSQTDVQDSRGLDGVYTHMSEDSAGKYVDFVEFVAGEPTRYLRARTDQYGGELAQEFNLVFSERDQYGAYAFRDNPLRGTWLIAGYINVVERALSPPDRDRMIKLLIAEKESSGDSFVTHWRDRSEIRTELQYIRVTE